jgi:site-specific DNA-methyltransferase (adenine-specific)
MARRGIGVIHHGDCIDVMAAMEPESIDAIVTDPPYNLTADTAGWRGKTGDNFNGRPDLALRTTGGFMGKAWDGSGIAFRRETWEAAYRVAKPSAYLLAFGGTRTVHRMTVALEDAGWIIRDMLVWGYASGFPKSKASLKPAWEPIVMARKPGPLRMLAIDECRIPTNGEVIEPVFAGRKGGADGKYGDSDDYWSKVNDSGRWPANIVLSDPIFDGGIEGVVGGGAVSSERGGWAGHAPADSGAFMGVGGVADDHRDTGTYSRFFLIPKAARSDREPVLGGLPVPVEARMGLTHGGPGEPGKGSKEGYEYHPKARANVHPTVKPTDLMRHLVRLVTPAGGTVLDPFLGSGTTGLAAEMEGFAWVGIEREAEYVAIAEARLNGTQRGLGLDVGAPIPKMPSTHPDLSKEEGI